MHQERREETERPAMTFVEWADLPEDEPGELVDGRLEEEEMPTFLHEIVVLWLGSVLRAWASARGGFAGASEGKFKVNERRGRKPDLFVYLKGSRRPAAQDALFTAPPTILVEVVTPRPRDIRRDRVEKANEYAAFRVRYYWLVDPAIRTLEILELGADGRYILALSATEGTITDVPGCEGLTLDLDALWAEVDRAASEPPEGE